MIEWIKITSQTNLKHQRQYLVSDGLNYRIGYLSKWSSLWYQPGGRAINMKITHYAELNTPRGLDSPE